MIDLQNILAYLHFSAIILNDFCLDNTNNALNDLKTFLKSANKNIHVNYSVFSSFPTHLKTNS